MQINIEDSRLAGLLTALFERWNLSAGERAELLGEWPVSELDGERRARGREILEVHAALRLLFPQNSGHRYGWVAAPNAHFEGRRPLDVMLADPQRGIPRVRAYLVSHLG